MYDIMWLSASGAWLIYERLNARWPGKSAENSRKWLLYMHGRKSDIGIFFGDARGLIDF